MSQVSWSRSLFFFVLAAVLSFGGLAGAQVAPGTPSFVPEDCHEVDCVDLMNNNVSLNVPIRSKAGAIPFNVSLNGSYYISNSGGTWQPSELQAAQFAPLTQASSYLGIESSGSSNGGTATCPNGDHTTEFSGFYIVAGGTYHYLPPADFTDTTGCYHTSITDATTDGSGYIATFNNHAQLTSVYDLAGNALGVGGITDSNGNSITFSSSSYTYTDTLGLTALTASSNGNFPNYSWTNVNGSSPQPQVSFTTSSTVTLKSAFGCSGVNDYDVTGQTLPSAINFPDGTSLGFTYEATPLNEPDVTGRLALLKLREGGTISYAYGGSNNGLNCTYQTVPELIREDASGMTTYTLAYSQISGSNYQATNTVVDPGGNETVYFFTGFTSAGNSSTYAQVVTAVNHYQGTSTWLTTDVYCYNTAFASCSTSSAPTAQVTFPITKLIVFHLIAGMPNWSATETHYSGNLVTYTAQYDFGGTTPVRATTITYGTCSAGCNTLSPTISAIGSNIYNKPGEVVTTVNGSTVAQTNYTYSTTAGHAGNLLSTSVWNGSAFIGQTNPNTYNTNGTIATSYDLANNETTYAYSSTGYSGCASCTQYPFPTSITNVGTGLTTSATYNGIGGVKLSDIDANLNTVATYCYNTGTNCSGGTADPYWRVMQVIDPYGNTVTRTYPTGSSPDTATGSFVFNSSNSIIATTTTTDGLGRPINTQSPQSPTATQYDTTSTEYGWSGNYSTVTSTLPCPEPSGSQCPFSSGETVTDFDPFGRPYTVTDGGGGVTTTTYTQNDVLAVLSPAPSGENNKQVQNQYDGLGRLTSSCAISSNVSGKVSCNQNTNTSATGVVTTTSYTSATGSQTVSSTRGSQTRSQTVDGLGRVTSITTPEGGTITNYYDSYAGTICGETNPSWPGQLVATFYANGNYIAYQYDSLGRVTLRCGVLSGAGGPNLCMRYAYDNSPGVTGTLPSGISPAYPYGHMVEAETDNCDVYPPTAASIITDEWFSYDKDGRVTTQWQSTPHSTQYYEAIATYTGPVITALQLASPSLYTVTYGLDGEGRWDSQSDSNRTFVTGPTNGSMYNAAGQALNVQLTGTTPDQDTYTYDPNTGRMKTFEFEVGNTPANLTGTLTWNPNGTLKELQVVDGFNSGGSETCYSNPTSATGTGYDDLLRLVGFDCGSGNWGQTFSLDQYDNLTKAVISGRTGVTYNPGFSSTTNQVTGATYDSSGDMTNNGNGAVYGWNPFNKLAWTAGSGTPTCGTNGRCPTYDAFGRMVEFSYLGNWTELWQVQVPGASISMNGTTANFGVWPAPGGLGAAVESGTPSFLHRDWLGSMRIASTTNHTVALDQAYAPYGEIYNVFGTSNTTRTEFAGQTADFDFGALFDTPNREFAQSDQGRWLSPDPAGSGWNQYAYVTNPNSGTDPSGLCPWCGVGAGSGQGGGLGGSFNGLCPIGDGVSVPCGTNSCNISLDGMPVPCGSGLLGSGESYTTIITTPKGTQYGLDAGGNVTNLSSLGGDALGQSDIDELGLPAADAFNNYSLGPAAAANNGPTNSATPPPCQAKILNATNNRFGTNYTDANVSSTFNYSTGAPPGQGTLNLNISGSTAGVTPGYSPVNWWTYVIGYGPTLHVVSGPGGNGGLDSQDTLQFGPNQATLHIDSGFPYNPIGLFFHWLLNMTKAGGYPQC
jgi:RHS repeat-associated protein